MATGIGVGFETIRHGKVASSLCSAKHPSRSTGVVSCAQRNHSAVQSYSHSFSSHSSVLWSFSGSPRYSSRKTLASGIRQRSGSSSFVSNCYGNRARIQAPSSFMKCGDSENSLCMKKSRSREGTTSGYRIRGLTTSSPGRANRKFCVDGSGRHYRGFGLQEEDFTVSLRFSGVILSEKRASRTNSTVTRCEAENDRVAIVESSEVTGDSGTYGDAGDKAVRGDMNGSPGEEGLQKVGELPVEGQVDARDHEVEDSPLEVLKEILRVAQEDLVNCRLNSERSEEKAQRIAERAIALREEAADAEKLVSVAMFKVEELLADERRAEEEFERATVACALAEELFEKAEAALEVALNKVKVRNGAQPTLENGEMGGSSGEANIEVVTERVVDLRVTSENPLTGEAEEVVTDKKINVTSTKMVLEGADAEVALSMANAVVEESEVLESARAGLRDSQAILSRCVAELSRLKIEKSERQLELMQTTQAAEKAKETALAADEDVLSAMAEAEKAVALELAVAQRVGDAETAVQKAESYAAEAALKATAFAAAEAEKLAQQVGKTLEEMEEELEQRIEAEHEIAREEKIEEASSLKDGEKVLTLEESSGRSDGKPSGVLEKGQEEDSKFLIAEASKEGDPDSSRDAHKRVDMLKELPIPKTSKKRSSRFFPASYFSSEDGEEFSPGKAFAEFATNLKPQLAKIVIGAALILAGSTYVNSRLERRALLPSPSEYSTTIEQVKTDTKPIVTELKKFTRRVKDLVEKLPAQEVNEEERSLFDVLWLLLASVIFVPLFMKIPGGSPVLGYLVAGVLIGPHTLHIIRHVHGTKAIAEFGVVFLLFNIGLELSVERLSSMKKYVFGLGTTQVLATAASVGVFLHFVVGLSGPAALVIGNGLALSSTAVVLQVLQERGESTSRHGRATFSVLLFQDLAVVVLLILIPLLGAKGGVGFREIAEALGIAAIKAVIAIGGIIAGGRLLLRPIYKQMADNHNAEIFAANTLLVVLGTSVLTARAGLSMALGAFLAGLLLAETEFALQVESDIAPYRGLLLGLFFMTVGMSIDPQLFVVKFRVILGALAALIIGKTVLFAAMGRIFGLSTIAAIRAGLLLAPGGEFAFVAFGEAVNQGIMTNELSSLLFLVVGLSMALTPWLAAGGQLIAARFEQQDVRSLLPQENETDDLQGHIIICGFGRVGQIIAQLLSERLIPFVALDVRSERVSIGRALDLPVYFGDAGSREVLHKVGANRAAAAVITLDTPGANYRTVWALSKHFPNVKTFVRAHDVDHGINLEKAGATAVVPETLEPSLQLAAAVLAQAKVPAYEIASAIEEFRNRHLSELTELSENSGTSLGYGFTRIMAKPKQDPKSSDDEGIVDRRVEGGIVAVP